MRIVFLVLLGLTLAGCSSVKICTEGGHKMCLVENSSWLFLNAFPIVSGDPDHPNENTCRWFTTTATLENNLKMLETAQRNQGAAEIRHPVSYTTDEMILFLLFKRYVYHTSAELVHHEGPTAEATEEPLLDQMLETAK